MAGLRDETHHSAAAVRVTARCGVTDGRAERRILHDDLIAAFAGTAKLDRHAFAAPGTDAVIGLIGEPGVEAIAAILKDAFPMAAGCVAGAGEAEDVAVCRAWTENALQIAMNRAAALAVAPAWHDNRTRDNSCALLPRPACCFEELVRAVGVPVGEQ